MTKPGIRLLLADDHQIVRSGLSQILSSQAEFSVVAQAQTGREAIQLYKQHLPDVCLIDLFLPDMSGIEVIDTLLLFFPSARTIILSIQGAGEDIANATRSGALSYLTKD